MIFAAGPGTRLKPLTDSRPKALVEIGGKSLLERCIRYLKAYGINNITINLHHFAGQIREYLRERENFGLQVQLSDESPMLLDTGGGLLKARDYLEGDEPVLLINVDVLTNLDLDRFLKVHRASGALVSLAARRRDTSRYLLFDQEGQLAGWKNVKTGESRFCRPEAISTAEPLAFSGIHLIRPELFPLITERGRFSIIELYLRLATTEKICSFPDRDSLWMDLGKYEQLDQAKKLVLQLDQTGFKA